MCLTVNVFDRNKNRVENEVIKAFMMNQGSNIMSNNIVVPTEIFTHDLIGAPQALLESFKKSMPIEMQQARPLQKAVIELQFMSLKAVPQQTILTSGESVKPSRYLLVSSKKYEELVLKITYRVDDKLRKVSQNFKDTGVKLQAPTHSQIPAPEPAVSKAPTPQVPVPTSPSQAVAQPAVTPEPLKLPDQELKVQPENQQTIQVPAVPIHSA